MAATTGTKPSKTATKAAPKAAPKAPPAAAPKKLNPGAQKVKDAAAKARADKEAARKAAEAAAQAAAAGKAKPASKAQVKSSIARDRAHLDAYVRANGNMSVARRTGVVGSALEKLGYTHEQARDIALDAPLNASMYDLQAIKVALEYADQLSKVRPGDAQTIGDAAVPGQAPVTMPERARRALKAARYQDYTTRTKAQKGVSRGIDRLAPSWSEHFNPVADKFANVPVPGGLGSIFMLNLLFLCMVVPANSQGYTRMQLLWLTLMNRTKLPEQINQEPVPASPVVQGLFNMAKSIDDAAVAVASLGSNAQTAKNIISGIQTPGQMIGNAIGNVPIVGGMWHLGTGQAYQVPQSNTGANPPPPVVVPPSPPTSGYQSF